MSEWTVPRYDYKAQFSATQDVIVPRILEILAEGPYILNEDVAAFEREFACTFGHEIVVGLNSGTDALHFALIACGIESGDEVIVPANTFYATAAAVAMVGARPVLVDADPHTFNIDCSLALKALGPKSKALLAVHLYGKCVPLSSLATHLSARGIALIEDAAQAHGSSAADGTTPGRFGGAVCYSFHPSKNLAAAGDGGALATNQRHIAEHVRLLRNLGQKSQNDHLCLGFNSKLDAIQAVVLRAKLPLLAQWNASRSAIAARYRELLRNSPVRFQEVVPGETHTYHLFQIRVSERDALLAHLRSRGIDAVIRYPVPIHMQAAFKYLGYREGEFPVAEALAKELLALPLYPGMPEASVEFVAREVQRFYST